MAWIEIHQNLPAHPKLIRLAAVLKEPPEQALGRLVKLWLWALDYADNGDLSRFGAVEISAACAWSKDSEILLKALQDTHWLDGMAIHDWMDYAGRLVEKRVANRERMKDARAKNVQGTTVARTGATVPNRTQPTEPSPPTPSGDLEKDFEIARKAYPGIPRGFAPEWEAFKKKYGKRTAEIVPLLLPAILLYKSHGEKKSRAENRPPMWKHFKTWLYQECWTTEYPGEGSKKVTTTTFNLDRVAAEAEERSQREWAALPPDERARLEALMPKGKMINPTDRHVTFSGGTQANKNVEER
ncbi:MAG: hypothetical protein JWO30_41 [Fibrobacteres bacterium]|nr:hypothetical protein [Fibrobacterota bacterium]